MDYLKTYNEKQEEKPTYKVYVDLDGVLCDFDGRFKQNVDQIGPDKYEKKHGMKKFWQEIEKHGIDHWSNMSWTSDGKRLWKFIEENFKDIEILTGSPWGKVGQYAHKGKDIWCDRELGNVKVNHKSAKQKYKFADENHILIDDTKRNTDMWKDVDGISIHHKSTKKTIEMLKKYLD